MEIIQSDQLTQRVEQIIRNFFKLPEDSNVNLSSFQDIQIRIEQIQQSYIENQLMLLQYLKQAFIALKEQLQDDFNLLPATSIDISEKKVQLHPLKNEDVKIADKLNTLTLKVYEMSKEMEDKFDILTQKSDGIAFNKDEILEEIKSLDARLESQWQGLANLSDQVWEIKQQNTSQPSTNRKKFGFF